MRDEHGRPKRDDELELDWKGRTAPEERAQETALAETRAGQGSPGDPRYMSLELRDALGPVMEGPGLRVHQMREWAEILVGWETRNRYEASDLEGRFLLYIGETGEGWGQALLRNLWPFRRVELEFMTKGGTRALSLEQPWTFFFTYVEVKAWDGRLMGTLQQRFGLLRRTFDICSPGGAVMATLEGPLWKPWTFHVKQRGEEVATIRKKWSGLGTEMFSDSDNFGVEFHPSLTDARLRQLVLAATLMVDLCYFEERSGHSGAVGGLLDFFD
ncbi:phospholipid scramblase-related protein [Vitiosangium sp. GDMCC 1.1324]|uniref:phospholipid scramblase-related protein n=1 Tax=Vitiosangium sp. (strain GDMCC 1.1324) TaxID=2138576 RepID=UPI000D386002|nr:phospholipid scramblase-related protein [Vitiosangium sp. GDMCC 1.1324]PTL78198.1 scramblase [Vitiosangium sp. GDMCC 1.1324]